MKNIITYSSLSLLLSCTLLPLAYAQEDNPSKEKPSNATIRLNTINVNARHWQEESIDVPVNVTVLKEEDIDGVTSDIYLIANKNTNVSLEESSVQTRVAIRGISGLDNGLQDPVGYFVNGVALPLGGNQLPTLFNLKSIEIIKGPQGALYGRNTEAGAVKINSIDPSWSLTGGAAIATGIADGADGNSPVHIINAGVSDTLLKDTLAGAFAFRAEDAEGPYNNNVDDNSSGGEVDKWSLSTGFHYILGDNTDVLFKTVIDHKDMGRNRFRFDDGANKTDRFTTNADTQGFDDSETTIHSLTLNHTFDSVDLIAITGFTDYNRAFAIDLDATPAPLPSTTLDLDNKSLSQEVRLSSNQDDHAFKWLAGLYFYDEESDIDFSISPMFMTTQRSTNIDQQGQAVFGQIAYALNNNWSASLGGRYERIEQSGQQNRNTVMTSQSYKADIDNTEFLPTASIRYQPSDHNTFYLTYSEGYLPGGYNYSSAGDRDSFTFDAEFSTLTELGWKNSAFSNRLNTTVTLFTITTDDKQIVDTLPGFVQSISNIGETKTYGIELGLDYQFSSAFSSYINVGSQQSEASSYQITRFGNTVDLSGNELPLAPEYTYSLGLAYEQNRGWFTHWALWGSSDYYFDTQNTLEQSAPLIVDADIGYKFKSATVSLWAKNITDEEVLSRAVSTPAGTVVEDTLVRTVGITLSADL